MIDLEVMGKEPVAEEGNQVLEEGAEEAGARIVPMLPRSVLPRREQPRQRHHHHCPD